MAIKLFRFLLIAFSLAICFITAPAQTPIKNYEKDWKQVNDYMSRNLPKSALPVVKKIYLAAKKDKQDAQLIKALVFMNDLQQENTENSEWVAIADMEKEMATNSEPAASILRSLTASMYWSYYQNHRWQLYDRTNTTGFKKEDPATWTIDDFHKKISSLYLSSIKNEKLLEDTRLESFDAIIVKGNVRHLRPTLYDLLANRALQYFENDERDISRPAYAFEINDAAAFAPAAEFAGHRFITRDSLSLQQKALTIYQSLLRFHINDVNPDAFIDADINRISFVYNQAVLPDKKNLYLSALNNIVSRYRNHSTAEQALYLVASTYNNDGSAYQPYGDSSHRWDIKKAKEICEQILQQKDSSEGRTNAANLLKSILRKEAKFEIESVNIPGKPFRALINYRNVPGIFLRLVGKPKLLTERIDENFDDKDWVALTDAKPMRAWTQNLPSPDDYQQHNAEIKIDALTSGEYVLLVSDNKEFDFDKGIVSARNVYISNIGYVHDGPDYFVLNRDSGEPISKASVDIWKQSYDYKASKYTLVKELSYQTDQKGYFHFKSNASGGSYLLDITSGSDRLFMNNEQYIYYTNNVAPEEQDTSVFIFTDRSIYRPGQTVFFKGIAITRNSIGKKNDITPGYKGWIYLSDANGENIDSIRVSANDYGSFSGKFQLPGTGLNGEFNLRMEDDKGEQSFSVEDYKRPKFSVEYENLKTAYKVNEQVSVAGTAKAYAGNNIDGAVVKYRVTRRPRYIYTWFFSKWWLPPTSPMEIAHGETKTDKQGKFTVNFTAIPDLTIDKKFLPVFDYIVSADVTDINGETRSGSKTVSVGYQSLLLNIKPMDKMEADSFSSLKISTTNLAGEFQAAVLKISITKLVNEKRLIRERYWGRPDQFVMTKNEYIQNFPYDEYDNESDSKTWAKDNTHHWQQTDSSRSTETIAIDDPPPGPGVYIIEVSTKDKDGQEVKDAAWVELYEERDRKPATPEYLWTKSSKPVEPGQTATVKIGSSAENVFLFQQVGKQSGNSNNEKNFSVLNLNNEIKNFSFPINEADRGGFGLNYFFAKHNRFYHFDDVVAVPWTNKELHIEYQTYREKTLPGSEEKWKLKITGYKNDAVAAEMLASMYDASLDQFKPHEWNEPAVWSYFSNYTSWESNQDFNAAGSIEKRSYDKYIALVKIYDALLDANLNSRQIRIRGTKSANVPLSNQELNEVVVVGYGQKKGRASIEYFTPDSDRVLNGRVSGLIVKEEEPVAKTDIPAQIRKNFNETAFFFPDLKTDSSGAIEFSFTIPEALTKWKLQALAHTKDLAFGTANKEVVTQKDLMVQPKAPRFLREGDRMEFSAKIVNLTNKELTGQAEFQLFNAETNEPVDGQFQNMFPNQYFTVAAGESEAVKFPIQVPYQFNKVLGWRIVARSGDYSDGEENFLPVLANKTLVTETLPISMRGTGTKSFVFEKLQHADESETLEQHGLTVEYSSNPAWYAVQALPYLMEFPFECAEQTWNRYYANALASRIANASPRIREVFEQWKTRDTAAFLSNLQKNKELKNILLEETPWVLQAKNEEQRKKNISLLFDLVKMGAELDNSFQKLKQMWVPDAGFVWFTGGAPDRYMTQYILTAIGHLQKLNAVPAKQKNDLQDIVRQGISVLDIAIKKDYDALVRSKSNLKNYIPDYMNIQYLYMRSFFLAYPVAKSSQQAYDYFRKQSQLYWTKQTKYMQGMIALALYRSGDSKTPADILRSLKETAIMNDEMGMYWKDQTVHGWFWYQAPIETQSLLIEAFSEAGKDTKTVDALKTWLLKNKQTNDWQTTKATAEACYALLLQGSNWLENSPVVEIRVGNTTVSSTGAEAGTGYFRKMIEGNKITPDMSKISVTVTNAGNSSSSQPSWGAVYWQYFENLDKISSSSTPLKLSKKLFVETTSERGPVLTPVKEGDELKPGDKITVRIELRADRDMEYLHMRDMRASALEPINVLSEYKWQDGLGYYESTRDASTNFFFDYVRKGTYVFEYSLFVTHAGNFSNGITTIESMYAPEFTSHSEGVRITVAE
jgi:uncharacterized protein YfaS (alpha-2-macroglobulin family)